MTGHNNDTVSIVCDATPAVANSINNFEGDRVIFPVNLQVHVDAGDGKLLPHCLKAGTDLRGIGQSSASTVNFVVIKCNPFVGFLTDIREKLSDWTPPSQCPVLCDTPPPAEPQNLATGSTVQIDLADIQKNAPNRYGLAYGSLVVPFKFQLMGAHQFTSSATIGPYLGYKFDTESYGWATTLALFAGASNIAVTKSPTPSSTSKPSTTTTSSSTEQVAGSAMAGGSWLRSKEVSRQVR